MLLQAMKEAFQNQLKGSKKCPRMGCFNMAHTPRPSVQPPGCGIASHSRAAPRPCLGGSSGPRTEPGLCGHQTLGKLLCLSSVKWAQYYLPYRVVRRLKR